MKQNKNSEEKIPFRRMVSNYGYVLRYAMKKDASLVVMIVGMITVSSVASASMDTLFLKAFIDFLSNPAKNFAQTAVLVTVCTLGIAVITTLDGCCENYSNARIVKIVGKVQQEMIEKASRMDLMCYDNDAYYDDFVIAASQIEDMMLNGVFITAHIFRNVFTILFMSGMVLNIKPVLAIFPILGFVVNAVTRYKITKLQYDFDIEKKKVMRRANYSKRVFYQPEYAKEIKLSHVEVPLEDQFHDAIDESIVLAKKYGKSISLWSLANYVIVFTLLSNYCVPMYLGYQALVIGSIGLGDVAALDNAQKSIRNRFDGMNYCLEFAQRVAQFAQRFRRFMEYESVIEGRIGTEKIPSNIETLEIKDMSFAYEGASKNTLNHINMTIKPGEKIAFVGENGAGKSTFVKLLMGLYDVTEGSINYGGKDIRSFTTKEYRNIFGSVFQDYQIYAASVRDNVLMKANEKDAPDEVIEEALAKAGFTERLKTLPHGLDTHLTREFDENGVQLSGGEGQKVAIARLFAKKEKMKVAILDEPSSALDPKAEYQLNKNMLNHAGDATVIFISHRLSTTKDADRIYMFEHGQIVEQGTHEELMAMQGQYAEMFTCQAKYYQENKNVVM